MTKARRRRQAKVLDTAVRGAAAGVIGGLAVSLLEREVLSRLAGGAPHRSGWDDEVARALARVGLPVHDGTAIGVGLTTQLLYAAVLGAGYAVARERTKDSRAGRTVVDAGLTYAASLVFPDIPQPRKRGRKRALRQTLVKPPVAAAPRR